MSFKFRLTGIIVLASFACTSIANAAALSVDTVVEQIKTHKNVIEQPAIIFQAGEVVQPLPGVNPKTITETPAPEKAAPTAGSLGELVAVVETPEELTAELDCMAKSIYFEARGEEIAGQLAVGQVIKNRAASGKFPSSYCGVVKQKSQFSFVKRGQLPSVKSSSSAWKQAKALAVIVDQGLWQSEVKDALYFHARYVKPVWSHQKTRRASIDSHIFYR